MTQGDLKVVRYAAWLGETWPAACWDLGCKLWPRLSPDPPTNFVRSPRRNTCC